MQAISENNEPEESERSDSKYKTKDSVPKQPILSEDDDDEEDLGRSDVKINL